MKGPTTSVPRTFKRQESHIYRRAGFARRQPHSARVAANALLEVSARRGPEAPAERRRDRFWLSYWHQRCSRLTDFDVRQSLHRVTARTVVLHGDCDTLFELNDAYLLSRGIPRAQLRVIPGAGHALPISHPEAVVTAVRDLVAELERNDDGGTRLESR